MALEPIRIHWAYEQVSLEQLYEVYNVIIS